MDCCQPPAKCLFNRVKAMAYRRLLYLRNHHVEITQCQFMKEVSAVKLFLKYFSLDLDDFGGVAGGNIVRAEMFFKITGRPTMPSFDTIATSIVEPDSLVDNKETSPLSTKYTYSIGFPLV